MALLLRSQPAKQEPAQVGQTGCPSGVKTHKQPYTQRKHLLLRGSSFINQET